MELLEAFLLFITAVIISSIIYNRFSKIPVAFIQIALGVCLFILPIPIEFEFDSEVFMFAVIAPLLFVEGTHVSRTKLVEYKKPIILMAMALVFTTVIGVGFFIHWIWPSLPMPAAFAIAAILCPTDAVAVSAITKGKILPKGSMSILEGESLLNDAAGIISFKIAVAALVTVTFSAMDAISQFIISTIIGILIGIIIGTSVVRLRVYLTANKGMKDNNTLTFIQLLTPFLVYFLAEVLHASGIIAVVVVGLIHGLERDRLIRAQTELQMNYNQIWNTLSYALNGFVFVVLGYIIPEVVNEIIKVEPENIVFLIGITLCIALAIYIFRYIWVYLWFNDFYYPKNLQSYLDSDVNEAPSRSKYAFIMTMCGIHGTISLSMALTLPYLIANHRPFEYRNDLLFIAALMVLISLFLAQVVLPLITSSEKEETFKGMSYQSAKIFIVQQVIDSFKKQAKANDSIDYRPILEQYFNELVFLINIEPDDKNTKELHRLEGIAERIETETLERLIEKGSITKKDITYYRGVMEHSQYFREASIVKKFTRVMRLILLRFKALRTSNKNERDTIRQEYQDNFKHVQQTMRVVNHNIMMALRKEQTSANVLEVTLVINRYRDLAQSLRMQSSKRRRSKSNELTLSPEVQRQLKLEALYVQRQNLDELIARNKITNEVAKQIRENINYNEIVLADESTH